MNIHLTNKFWPLIFPLNYLVKVIVFCNKPILLSQSDYMINDLSPYE